MQIKGVYGNGSSHGILAGMGIRCPPARVVPLPRPHNRPSRSSSSYKNELTSRFASSLAICGGISLCYGEGDYIPHSSRRYVIHVIGRAANVTVKPLTTPSAVTANACFDHQVIHRLSPPKTIRGHSSVTQNLLPVSFLVPSPLPPPRFATPFEKSS